MIGHARLLRRSPEGQADQVGSHALGECCRRVQKKIIVVDFVLRLRPKTGEEPYLFGRSRAARASGGAVQNLSGLFLSEGHFVSPPLKAEARPNEKQSIPSIRPCQALKCTVPRLYT